MHNNMYISALNHLLAGDPSPVEDSKLFFALNEDISRILNIQNLSPIDIEELANIIHIANIVYNNFPIDDDDLFIDNGVYDLLLEKYKVYNKNFQVGAEPIQFNYAPKVFTQKKNCKNLVSWIEDYPDYLFSEITPVVPINNFVLKKNLVSWMGNSTGKKLRLRSHDNNTLIGSLDKCKIVLLKEAEELGLDNDPKVKVLERDFFGDQFKKGIINNNTNFRMLLELKYDGISIVVTVKNGYVVQAVSRGDTGLDQAVDYTSIFYGYIFPDLPPQIEMDIKCEAVMTYQDLIEFNKIRGYDYKNARSAIIGLISLNDGYKYRDFITLVPLKVAHSSLSKDSEYIEDLFLDRTEEVVFMNDFLVTKEPLRYSYVEGNYIQVLYLIKRFVEEAEYMRPYMNTMYDGVVISYVDREIIEILGRENFINKWSMAIKFKTMKKITKLLGITYTVGQNGVITPMAHYQPIEFNGTIHSKSSIASYKRFNINQFKIGNKIQVEYINDVMPYVSTPKEYEYENSLNENEIIQFITHCPKCGQELKFSEKSAICTNIDCKGRRIARMSNMMQKLNLKGFAEESMDKLDVSSLSELINLSIIDMCKKLHSEILGTNLYNMIEKLKTTPVYDYIIIGALGFTNISQGTWQLIFREISIEEILELYLTDQLELGYRLSKIKGIGNVIIKTILDELYIFYDDIMLILSWNIIIPSKGIMQKKIRVSGFRDPELMNLLCSMGYDASDKSVTKDTFILLIPYEGYSSTKLKNVGKDTQIVIVDKFKENMNIYLEGDRYV